MVDVNDEPDDEVMFPVQSSTAKLAQAMLELQHIEPDGPLTATLLLAFNAMGPMLENLLPDDPAELDEMLLTVATWLLGMRSDDAHQPETITELFLGGGADAEGTCDPE